MLAGAVFNRATDIFTKLVEIQTLGVAIQPDNALMRECGELLQEAITLGKLVLHRSGEEGIDELWGEPWKAFLYRSRSSTGAATSRSLRRCAVSTALRSARSRLRRAAALRRDRAADRDFVRAAKQKCETLRTDPDIFDVWASFVVPASD